MVNINLLSIHNNREKSVFEFKYIIIIMLENITIHFDHTGIATAHFLKCVFIMSHFAAK